MLKAHEKDFDIKLKRKRKPSSSSTLSTNTDIISASSSAVKINKTDSKSAVVLSRNEALKAALKRKNKFVIDSSEDGDEG